MASVNKVILVGNLGKDPETRYAPNGDAICNITLATTDSWKDKATGEKKEQTEWHRISFFGALADIAGKYLTKGSAAYVEGSLRTRKWKDKEGQDRYTTEIRADRLQMLGGKPSGQTEHGREKANAYQPEGDPIREPTGFSGMDDDIPFMNPYFGRRCYVV